MNILDQLFPKKESEPYAKVRVLPSQETLHDPLKVNAGADAGEIPYTGERPLAGDTVVIHGPESFKIASSGQATAGLSTPIFSEECICKCGSASGVGVFLTRVAQVANLIAFDVDTGRTLQFFGLNELGYGVANAFSYESPIAIDPVSPNNLYVLDDRRFFQTLQTDNNVFPIRGYFTLVTYTIDGGKYVPTSYLNFPDPYVQDSSHSIFPAVEPDPPASSTPCMSVINGVIYITMLKSPARYLTIQNGVITTHTILQNNAPLSVGLRGPIVAITSPAKKTDRFVVGAADNATVQELIRFDTSDIVVKTIDLMTTSLTSPGDLAGICNRLFVSTGIAVVGEVV